MKKSFSLHVAGKDDARVLEAIKGDVRKYLKRERRKPVKTGVDFWDFDCRVGVDQASAVVTHPAVVIEAIDATARTEGAATVFVELLAKPGVRAKKVVALDPAAIAAGAGVVGLAATDAVTGTGVGATPATDGAGVVTPFADYIAPSDQLGSEGDGDGVL